MEVATRRPWKILIIDDSELVLAATRGMLESLGFLVVTVSSPIGAVLVAAEERPDLVLVDLSMASLSGDRVVSSLKRNTRTSAIPVLIYSDRSAAEVWRSVEASGADGAIPKTGDELLLYNALRNYLSP